MSNTNPIDQYRVIGNPIKHSKSPFIHTLFARQTAQHMEYQILEIPLGEFKKEAEQFFSEGGKGCNITAPFKEDAYNFAGQLTERAQLAGAVNTLKKLDDGLILGDNTDGEGLVQDLIQYRVPLAERSILIIGAGGATRGVIKPLLDQGVESITIVNRTFEKAQQLAEYFQPYGNVKAVDMGAVDKPFDVIINATSAGLSGNLPKISPAIFSATGVSYDMTYKSDDTGFNQWAKENGSGHCYDGLGMLVGQAAESFMLWRGIRPSIRQVLTELRRNLA